MYYKRKENFTLSNTMNYKPNITGKFPTWGLVLIVLLISLAMMVIFYQFRNKSNKTQQFGFRFY